MWTGTQFTEPGALPDASVVHLQLAGRVARRLVLRADLAPGRGAAKSPGTSPSSEAHSTFSSYWITVRNRRPAPSSSRAASRSSPAERSTLMRISLEVDNGQVTVPGAQGGSGRCRVADGSGERGRRLGCQRRSLLR